MIKRSTLLVIGAFILLLFVWLQLITLNIFWDDTWVESLQPAGFSATASANLGLSDFSPAFPGGSSGETGAQAVEEALTESEKPPQYFVLATSENDVYRTVTLTMNLLKIPFLTIQSLDDIPPSLPDELIGMVLCEGDLDAIGDIENMFSFIDPGRTVIMAALLDTSAANYQAHYADFGVDSTGERFKQESVDFLENLLISGTHFETEVNTETNTVSLNGKSRIYAVGFDEDVLPHYNRNPIIWRTYYGDGHMYVVNARILEDFSFVGILTGLLGLDKDVFVYPYVNAKTVVINGLPYFSTENEAYLKELYIRDVVQYQRDVLWSDLNAIASVQELEFTFMPYVGTDQFIVESGLIQYIGKEISYNKSEIGAYPSDLMAVYFPNYQMLTEYSYPFDGVTSKITLERTDYGFLDEDTVSLPMVTQGAFLSNGDVYKSLSTASALGYVSYYIDMLDILQDTSGQDLWDRYRLDFNTNLYSISQRYSYIQTQTAAAAAERMKIYLASQPDITVEQNSITLKAQDIGTTYYVVRTERRITGTENCTVEKIASTYYLVEVQSEDAVIRTIMEDDIYFD